MYYFEIGYRIGYDYRNSDKSVYTKWSEWKFVRWYGNLSLSALVTQVEENFSGTATAAEADGYFNYRAEFSKVRIRGTKSSVVINIDPQTVEVLVSQADINNLRFTRARKQRDTMMGTGSSKINPLHNPLFPNFC